MDGDGGNIRAVNQNLTGIYIVETAEQIDDGGFSGPVGPTSA